MLSQRPHSIGLAPTQEQGARITTPLILTSVLPGGSNVGNTVYADLVMEDAEGVINNVQTMFVDASKMSSSMILYFEESQQTLFINPQTQGYYPIAVGQQVNFSATAFTTTSATAGSISIKLQFLNIPVSPCVWAATGVTVS